MCTCPVDTGRHSRSWIQLINYVIMLRNKPPLNFPTYIDPNHMVMIHTHYAFTLFIVVICSYYIPANVVFHAVSLWSRSKSFLSQVESFFASEKMNTAFSVSPNILTVTFIAREQWPYRLYSLFPCLATHLNSGGGVAMGRSLAPRIVYLFSLSHYFLSYTCGKNKKKKDSSFGTSVERPNAGKPKPAPAPHAHTHAWTYKITHWSMHRRTLIDWLWVGMAYKEEKRLNFLIVITAIIAI